MAEVGLSVDRIERRLVRLWARVPADPTGAAWYGNEARSVRNAAALAGVDPDRALAALAVLSPAARWEPLRDAFLAGLAAWVAASAAPRLPAYGRNVAKAGKILAGTLSVADGVTGPKVRAFFANLRGDGGPVTVDRWAYTLATGDRTGHPTPRQFRECAEAYTALAGRVGLAPAAVQAALWVRFRKGFRRRRRAPREACSRPSAAPNELPLTPGPTPGTLGHG